MERGRRKNTYNASRRNNFLSVFFSVLCFFSGFFPQDFGYDGRAKCYHLPDDLYEKDEKRFIYSVLGWRQYCCSLLFLPILQ